jgi:two-component system cell cycle response regulator CpdR
MATILLAEDDEAMRSFLAGALERAGHVVVAVADGAEAMGVLESKPFDLLLADVVMPGMDGLELARRAILQFPELRVMFITGFAAMILSGANLPRHRAQVLSKPFHLRRLVDEVEKILAA